MSSTSLKDAGSTYFTPLYKSISIIPVIYSCTVKIMNYIYAIYIMAYECTVYAFFFFVIDFCTVKRQIFYNNFKALLLLSFVVQVTGFWC